MTSLKLSAGVKALRKKKNILAWSPQATARSFDPQVEIPNPNPNPNWRSFDPQVEIPKLASAPGGMPGGVIDPSGYVTFVEFIQELHGDETLSLLMSRGWETVVKTQLRP